MPGRNALKVIPVPSINSLIIIANSQAKVRRAITWIRRLDRENITTPSPMSMPCRTAMPSIWRRSCSATFGAAERCRHHGRSGARPGEIRRTVSQGPAGRRLSRRATWMRMPQPPGTQADQQDGDWHHDRQHGARAGAAAGGGTGSSGNGIRITPIPANNTLLIRASPKDYREILSTLGQIDAPATQVLINTTIAEVTLNDDLRYGVQAYFQSGNFSFSLTDSSSGDRQQR